MICDMSEKAKTSSKKRSTVRHTRAIQRDRSMRPIAAPPAEQVSARLQEVILPAVQAKQEKAHHDFGVRARKLTLVVMTAFVISLIWRQVGSVSDGVRLLNTEGLLWAATIAVSQQAVSQRLAACRRDFPANPICGTLCTCSDKLLIAGRNAHGPQIQKG